MDLAPLIEPFNGATSSGEDMSFSTEFDAIADARRFDDPSLSQGEWVTEIKQANWPEVVRLSTDLLSTRTKDLRLAVWLTEALTKTQGAVGLAQGFELITELCAKHWDSLHPQPDDDGDQEQRIGNLEWILGRTDSLVRDIPLTQSAKGRYSSADLESAMNLSKAIERSPNEAEALQANARLTQADFDAARDDTPDSYFVQTRDGARAALRALHTLQQIIDDLLGADGPGFGAARSALENFEHTLGRFTVANDAEDISGNPDESTPDNMDSTMTNQHAAGAVPHSGPLQTRAQALQQLRQVAEFFRRTEPHSPVAYLADKAAKWGEMNLHEWLQSVVKDDGTLAHVEELLGVPKPYQSDDQYE